MKSIGDTEDLRTVTDLLKFVDILYYNLSKKKRPPAANEQQYQQSQQEDSKTADSRVCRVQEW